MSKTEVGPGGQWSPSFSVGVHRAFHGFCRHKLDKISSSKDTAHRLHRQLAVGWASLRFKAPYDDRQPVGKAIKVPK